MNEALKPTLHTRVVLNKYEGDDQTKEPIETVVIEDGQIVSVTKREH